MKCRVLIDNNTIIDRYFSGEPGLSFLIEAEGKRILFDAGYSDALLENARKLGENLLDLDYIVFSHGHMDHTWGLDSLIKLYSEAKAEKLKYKSPAIVGHPLVFETKLDEDLGEIGSMISKEKASQHFKIQLTKQPLWLTSNLVFLGEIERNNDFENKSPIGKISVAGAMSEDFMMDDSAKAGSIQDDYMLDDSALAYKTGKGLIIITGCSHSGICNIIEQAKKICNEDRIVDVIGGLHLLNPDKAQLDGTLDYLKKIKVTCLHPCHCTDLTSKIALSTVAQIKEVGSGLLIEY